METIPVYHAFLRCVKQFAQFPWLHQALCTGWVWVATCSPRVPAGLRPAEIIIFWVCCGGKATTTNPKYFLRRPEVPHALTCGSWIDLERERGSHRGSFLAGSHRNAIRRDRLLPVHADVCRIRTTSGRAEARPYGKNLSVRGRRRGAIEHPDAIYPKIYP